MSQLTYIPYLPLGENQKIDFGNGLIIWHFGSQAEVFISDPMMREWVRKLIDANVEGETPKKIKGVSVVSIGQTDFRSFTPEEQLMVHEAKLTLFLSRIARANTTILGTGADAWSLATSENFQPVFQNFETDNDHIAEQAGYIVNIGIGGYRVNEKKFYKPSHVVISPYGMKPFDEELFRQLCVHRKKGKCLYRKIIRATELLFQAYYNSSNVSINARLLLIASAFETLLDLPEELEGQGRRYFKDAVEKYCDIPGEQKYRHYYLGRKKKHRDKDRSIKVLWADSFFELRNQIIHGDIVSQEMYQFRHGDRHLDIAILFFCLLVKQLLNDGKPSKPFDDYTEWKEREDGTTGFHYEDRATSRALTHIIMKAPSKEVN
jgi:hypothetical protein